MSNLPSISVVIPTHNRLPILLRALEHLASGTVIPDEVILVDDGSESPVAEPVSSRHYPFPALHIIRLEPGKGASTARNTGARAASGDIVVFLDDDIFVEKETVNAHRRLHMTHPEENYGVMARITFDPELCYTPLMRWLEECGDFASIANGQDGTFQPGLISANFSLKNAFLHRQNQLFDCNFPFYGNEDTEFGYRMVATRGLNLRYHTSPGALHHSPIDITTKFMQIYKGGVCKTYWSLYAPEMTNFALKFGQSFFMKLHEKEFHETFLKALDYFGDTLKLPAAEMEESVYHRFDMFIRFSRRAIQDIGQFDGALGLNASVYEMIGPLKKAFLSNRKEERLDMLWSAYACDPLFFPMAWFYAQQLCYAGLWSQADRIMMPFTDNAWAILMRSACALVQSKLTESKVFAEKALEMSSPDIPMGMTRRQIALKFLHNDPPRDTRERQRFVMSWHEAWRDGLQRKISWIPESREQAPHPLSGKKVLDDLFAMITRPASVSNVKQLQEYYVGSGLPTATSGYVHWYTPKKHFGFIKPCRGNRMLIFQYKKIKNIAEERIRPGMPVSFTSTETVLGLEASEISEWITSRNVAKDAISQREIVPCPDTNTALPPHVIFLGFNSPQAFSGGRYHIWLMAEAAAEAGWRVSFITNCHPSFYDEFGDKTLFPCHDDIQMFVGPLHWDSMQTLSCSPCDVIVMAPHGEGNDHVYDATLALARREKAKLVLINFETANWFNELSPVKRSEMTWWDGWRKIAENASMILSLAAEGTGYAKEFYVKHHPGVLFEHCWPALNTRIADTVPDVQKEKRILVMVRFRRAEHKGDNLIKELLCEAMRGYTVVFIVGIGRPDDEFLVPIQERAAELGIQVEVLGRVTEREKWHEFKRASLVLFPSYFEGFGLPPVEAQYAGTPCIAFDLPVLREVSGDGIQYVPPGDIPAMRANIGDVLLAETPPVGLKKRLGDAVRFEDFKGRVDAILKRALYEGPFASDIMP